MEGNRCIIKTESLKAEGEIVFKKPKSYSVIALNLETIEDVEKVIRQCESLKEKMTGGYWKPAIKSDGSIVMEYH